MKPTGATREATGEPTPRPWRAVALLPDGLEHHIIAGEFRDGSAIASTDNPNGLVAYADMPANAQLIVTAVNERERLREALRGVAIMLNTELDKYDKEPWAQRVRAALSDQNEMREG